MPQNHLVLLDQKVPVSILTCVAHSGIASKYLTQLPRTVNIDLGHATLDFHAVLDLVDRFRYSDTAFYPVD